MLLAHEWSGFLGRSKSLRVSSRRHGQQRSTYFLQPPYRYALPLLCFSVLLHWLASQSLAVVSVELYSMFGVYDSTRYCDHKSSQFSTPDGGHFDIFCGNDLITLSYAPLGILLSPIVAVVLTTGLFLLGRRKPSPMPVVGSCSAAIAASCHARPSEQAPPEKPLRWGAFTQGVDQQHSNIGHYRLSSDNVEQPAMHALYT
jgi:hypothetical protein